MRLIVCAKLGEQQILSELEVMRDTDHDPLHHYLFFAYIRKDVTLLDIKSATMADADVENN